MRGFICALILLAAFCSLYKASALYAGPVLEEVDPALREKELREKENAIMKLVYEKMIERTKECKETIDSLFFTLNSLRVKAREGNDIEREKELIAVFSDYNSFLGDLGVMQVILDLADFIEDERFVEYFELMANAFEHLKSSFSLKNELFLKRIDELKDKDALGYEKRLLRLFREYFEYDLWQEKVGDSIEKGD